jgi:hypothetical protein
VDSFIYSLSNDVKVIRQLPDMNGKKLSPYKMRIPRKCTPKCYENRVLPALLKKHVSIAVFELYVSLCLIFSAKSAHFWHMLSAHRLFN